MAKIKDTVVDGYIELKSRYVGSIEIPSIFGSDNRKQLCFCADSYDENKSYSDYKGAMLFLTGSEITKDDIYENGVAKENVTDAELKRHKSCFILRTHDDTRQYNLFGRSNGSLYWGGYLSVAGIDVNGENSQSVMIGNQIELSKPNNTTGFEITGGTTYTDGALLTLYGDESSESGVAVMEGNSGARAVMYSNIYQNQQYQGVFNFEAKTTREVDTNTKHLYGFPDGTLSWNGQSIQTTSDERKKEQFEDISDEVLDAWKDVNWTSFKFKEDVLTKGDSARKHTGVVAQQILNAFKKHNLDATKYGLICHNEVDDIWMVRYEEALSMESIYQRRRADKLEKELESIKERLTKLEQVIPTRGL